MRQGIGLGVGINRSNYAQGIFSAYQSRVIADGGVVEAGTCVDAVSGILLNASLLLIPSGYKANKLYSEIPTNGYGDLTWTRTSTAIRTNSSALLESMATGVPRLSYMYGSCPSALLEPQRTNLFLWSSAFTNGVWLSGGGGTGVYTDNFATSPDGTQNAARWTAAGAGYQTRQNVATINTTATLSVWMRTNSGTKSVSLFINDGVSGVSTITVTTTWQRFTVTAAIGGTLSGGGRCGWYNNSILTNTDYIEVFGAQYEIGSFQTTYIPTTSATATRVADSFSRSNIYTNGLISASGGTWFVELRGNVSYVRDMSAVNLFIGDNSSSPSNSLAIRNASTSTTRLSIQKIIAGTYTILTTPSSDTIKVAFKWNGTSADVFVNGTKEISATAFTTTNMEFLACTAPSVPLFIQQMALFPSALTDAQCQTLTT